MTNKYYAQRISEDTFNFIVALKKPETLRIWERLGYAKWYNPNNKLILLSRMTYARGLSTYIFIKHFETVDFKEWDCDNTFVIRSV